MIHLATALLSAWRLLFSFLQDPLDFMATHSLVRSFLPQDDLWIQQQPLQRLSFFLFLFLTNKTNKQVIKIFLKKRKMLGLDFEILWLLTRLIIIEPRLAEPMIGSVKIELSAQHIL